MSSKPEPRQYMMTFAEALDQLGSLPHGERAPLSARASFLWDIRDVVWAMAVLSKERFGRGGVLNLAIGGDLLHDKRNPTEPWMLITPGPAHRAELARLRESYDEIRLRRRADQDPASVDDAVWEVIDVIVDNAGFLGHVGVYVVPDAPSGNAAREQQYLRVSVYEPSSPQTPLEGFIEVIDAQKAGQALVKEHPDAYPSWAVERRVLR